MNTGKPLGHRLSRRSVLAGAGVALMSRSALAQVSDDVVKVGVLTDMSGIFSDNAGIGMVTAAKMAVEDFGGSVVGRPIEVIFANHQNKPDIATGIARNWIDTEHVDVIVDAIGSSVALAVQSLAADKNRVLLNIGSGASDLTGKACTPVSVQWVWDTYAVGTMLGQAMIDHGRNSFFFITADYAFGEQMQRDTSRAILAGGGTILGSIRHPFGQTDFSSAMLQAASSKATVIVLANAGGDTINAVKAAGEFQLMSGGTQSLAALVGIREIRSLGLAAAQGIITPTSFYWDRDDDTRAFAVRFSKRTGFTPGELQAGGYSAVRHYLKAIEQCGTDEAKSVVRTMKSMPVADFFAQHARLREDGRMVHDMYLVQVKAPADSKNDWDVMKTLETYPGDKVFRPLQNGKCQLVSTL
jgi:branched-chain amino acid transport system substrate-binding protein